MNINESLLPLTLENNAFSGLYFVERRINKVTVQQWCNFNEFFDDWLKRNDMFIEDLWIRHVHKWHYYPLSSDQRFCQFLIKEWLNT